MRAPVTSAEIEALVRRHGTPADIDEFLRRQAGRERSYLRFDEDEQHRIRNSHASFELEYWKIKFRLRPSDRRMSGPTRRRRLMEARWRDPGDIDYLPLNKAKLHEQALRQIMNAAVDLENGEDHPIRCAQDIQKIVLAALEGRALPDIFALWPRTGGVSGG